MSNAIATPRTWVYRPDRDHSVMVRQLPSGAWLGAMGPNPNLDRTGSLQRSEAFATVEEALDFVGWPHEIVGIPAELK